MLKLAAAFVLLSALLIAQSTAPEPTPLPSGQRLDISIPGSPRPINSLPVAMAVSPDGRYVAILNAGYGVKESKFRQSIAILDVATDQLTDFPDARLGQRARQTFFGGLAWSSDGKQLYASIASLSDPKGEGPPPPRNQPAQVNPPVAGDEFGHQGEPNAASKPAPQPAPQPKANPDTGNGIAVYAFENGKLAPERFIRIAPQPIPAGKHAAPDFFERLKPNEAAPYPAGIAFFHSAMGSDFGMDFLLVANNLSDNAVLLEIKPQIRAEVVNGRTVVQPFARKDEERAKFDLSGAATVPTSYPVNIVATRLPAHHADFYAGKRAWVSLWNASAVMELDPWNRKIIRRIPLLDPGSPQKPGSHPTAMLLSPDEGRLYVALSNRDMVAELDTLTGTVLRWLDTRLPGDEHSGTIPVALAQSSDGKKLFVADAGANAIAVFDLTSNYHKGVTNTQRALGFIPTEWYPTALAVVKNKQGDPSSAEELVIAAGKGRGSQPNAAEVPVEESGRNGYHHLFVAAGIHGSVARLKLSEIGKNLPAWSAQVIDGHRARQQAQQVAWANGRNPIKHVIYIIKENRTYDQVFGDIVGANGDPSLVMYGEAVTPNQHKLARQFGVLDNFYASAEVSPDGHLWSVSATTTDFMERWWQVDYRSWTEHAYNSEGLQAMGVPLLQNIPDLSEPATGYLWQNALRHGLSFRTYGEYVWGQWCWLPPSTDKPIAIIPAPPADQCVVKAFAQGELLPRGFGEGRAQTKQTPSPYPWKVPVLGGVVPTKAELRGRTDLRYAPYELQYPDQLRADEFLNEFDPWALARKQTKKDTMPSLLLVRLGNDHTRGATADAPKPEAFVADNDLALGRIVDAVSHSAYWDDTAIFVVEDDAQNGPDHVDAHRTIALVISKYSPTATNVARPGGSVAPPSSVDLGPSNDSASQPFVDHHFYTTVHMVRTIEALLGLPPMNINDAGAEVIAPLFTGRGQQPPFTADARNRDNGLMYQLNPKRAPGSAASARLNFSIADAADPDALNRILWRAAKGNVPMPAPKHTIFPATRDRD
jgi:DNA-binding beta-propeller fold protein YncE